MSNTFVEREEDVLRSAVAGDVVRLEGKLVRVVKRTSSAVAVVPYRWYHAVLAFLHTGRA